MQAPAGLLLQAWDRQRSAAIERLEAAEKVAGSVAKRLPGAVQKARRRCSSTESSFHFIYQPAMDARLLMC